VTHLTVPRYGDLMLEGGRRGRTLVSIARRSGHDPPEPRSRGGDRRRRLRLAGCHHYIGPDGIVARRGRFRFVLGIGDAAVQHRHKRESETLRNHPHVAQSEITFVELMVTDTLVDDVVNKLFDLRWRRLFQAT